MASPIANDTAAIARGASTCGSFGRFFKRWLCEQDNILQELISASHYHNNNIVNANGDSSKQTLDHDDTILTQLISRVISQYERYYRSKSRCYHPFISCLLTYNLSLPLHDNIAKDILIFYHYVDCCKWAHHDVFTVLSPSWKTALEGAHLWIGGWRPSMAFHLLYSKPGLQFESQATDLIFGLGNGDLADLSITQVNQINELHARTLREEREITGKMAKRQEKVADRSMVELSHAETETTLNGGLMEKGLVEDALEGKADGLEQALKKADELRLKTLKFVLEILTPIQAVHFLIAAAELHLRIHDWGLKKDAKNGAG